MEQLVKTYKRGLFGTAADAFAKDAKKLAKKGWTVATSTTQGGLFVGQIVVTYQKGKEQK